MIGLQLLIGVELVTLTLTLGLGNRLGVKIRLRVKTSESKPNPIFDFRIHLSLNSTGPPAGLQSLCISSTCIFTPTRLTNVTAHGSNSSRDAHCKTVL